MADSRRPARIWYVYATSLLIASAAVAIGSMVLSINVMQFTTVELPGTLEVDVQEAGEWVVCIQSDDGSYPEVVPMEIRFTSSLGEERPLETSERVFRYRTGSVHALEVGGADLSTGVWTMIGTHPDPASGADQRWAYAVGPSPIDRMAGIMVFGGSIAVILMSAGLGLLALVFWYRFRNRPRV